MKHVRLLFWSIVFLTIVALLIDIPRTIPVSLDYKVPLFNKEISVHKTFSGFNPDLILRPLHIQKNFEFVKGLDLDGGVSITYKADTSKVANDQKQSAVESAKNVIENRINRLGVREPVVQTATVNGQSRIIVELPGVTDVNSAMQLIGATAQLTFWEEGASESAKQAPTDLPLGLTQLLGPNPKQTNLTGKDLQQASVTFSKNTSQPEVQLTFTSDGSSKFADITKRNVGKIVAIILDNQVIQAPRVNEPILTGNAVISGGFTTEQAKRVAIQLNAGALPIPLSVLEQRTIGATLGQASLQKSLFAGILGFLVIVIFMSVLYGRLGMLASVALVLYTLFTLALFKLIPVTLTLAGIAGFILSIGMAVDANILIFERMKEEIRRGKNQHIAMELGFVRAWTSIRDSNMSTLITSAILYTFGNGIVRGFALTLAVGVLVSMFSAIVVTRTFLRTIYR